MAEEHRKNKAAGRRLTDTDQFLELVGRMGNMEERMDHFEKAHRGEHTTLMEHLEQNTIITQRGVDALVENTALTKRTFDQLQPLYLDHAKLVKFADAAQTIGDGLDGAMRWCMRQAKRWGKILVVFALLASFVSSLMHAVFGPQWPSVWNWLKALIP